MKKNKFFSFVVIFLFELLFYIFDFTSNTVICVPPNSFKPSLLPYIFLNTIMFLSMFIICLKLTSTEISYKKIFISSIWVLLGKCFFDIIYAFICKNSNCGKFIGDIFHVLSIILIFIIIGVVWKLRPIETNTSIKINICLFILETLSLIILGVVLIKFFNNTSFKYNTEKIMAVSEYKLNYIYYVNGATELYSFISVFLRSLIFLSLVNIFDDTFKPTKLKTIRFSFFTYSCILLCCLLNLGFNNDSMLSGIDYQKHIEDKNISEINIDYSIFYLYRGIGEDRHLHYTTEANTVYYGTTSVCTFDTHPLSASSWFVDYGDYEHTSIVCQNEIIAFLDENEEWTTIKFKNLKNAEKNTKLSSVLKNICATGNFEATKYALPYFQKYEPNYINELNAIINEASINDEGNWLLTEHYSNQILSSIN